MYSSVISIHIHTKDAQRCQNFVIEKYGHSPFHHTCLQDTEMLEIYCTFSVFVFYENTHSFRTFQRWKNEMTTILPLMTLFNIVEERLIFFKNFDVSAI